MISLFTRFCSDEVKLLLIRMESFPEDFIDDRLHQILLPSGRVPGAYPNFDEKVWRWRRIVKVGVYSWLERIVLDYSLRKVDKKMTKQKIYEILI